MNNLEKALEAVGVKEGVPFMIKYGNDNYRMMLEGGKLKYYDVYLDRYKEVIDAVLVDILVGNIEVKEVEFPVFGDIYYIPDLINGYKTDNWMNSKLDIFYKENNLVCKTKERAIQLSDYFKKSAKNLNFDKEG